MFELVEIVSKKRPTKRAPDKWESARFTGFFLTSGLYCSQAESTFRPLAGNANRSAARAEYRILNHALSS